MTKYGSHETPVDIMQEEIEQLLGKHSQKGNPRTPDTIQTVMCSLGHAYARVHGEKNSCFGDLTWLTLENLKLPGKYPTARPLFEGAGYPGATGTRALTLEPETVRKNLVAFRAVLHAVGEGTKAAPADVFEEAYRQFLLDSYRKAYIDLGREVHALYDVEQKRLATREPSKRQQSKWVSWPEVRRATKVVCKSLEQAFAHPPIVTQIHENKRVQRSLQWCMYVMVPPVRGGDHAGMRFVDEKNENVETLRESGSPNYILVKEDGTMEMVYNEYKTDRRAMVDDYDPGTIHINHGATVRLPLVENETLTKYRFDPVKLAKLLTHYRQMQKNLLGERNPYEYIFFDLKNAKNETPGPVQKALPPTLTARMTRVSDRLMDRAVGASMLRTVCISWFNSKQPTMEEREALARWMMHKVQMQLGTYSKGTMVPPQVKRAAGEDGAPEPKRKRVTLENLRI